MYIGVGTAHVLIVENNEYINRHEAVRKPNSFDSPVHSSHFLTYLIILVTCFLNGRCDDNSQRDVCIRTFSDSF